MPKRSNDFQRLIKVIYEQMAPAGASVTESALLPEYGAPSGPEIDVLVEFPVSGTEEKLRIAIECRDHSRRVDKTWINELIGKYRDVPVDRVIAVSRTEFTSGARKKARQANIEVRTLARALETDWPKDLMLIAVGEVSHEPDIGRVEFVATPPWPDSSEPVAVRLGGQFILQNDYKLFLLTEIKKAFNVEIERQRRLGPTELGNFGTHPITLEILGNELVFISRYNTEHLIIKMTLQSTVTVSEKMLTVNRYRFGKVGVSLAQTTVGDGSTIMVVQEPGRPPSAKLVNPHKI